MGISNASPVEIDVFALRDLGNVRVFAHGRPNLSLKLPSRNIIAKERIVCGCQHCCTYNPVV